MASHLAPAGLDVTVYDLVAERMSPLVEGGARSASSLRELAERSDVLCICVPTDDDVRSVVLGDGEVAAAELRKALSIPSTMSVAWLRVDPRWDRVRESKPFVDLIAEFRGQ